MFVVVFADAVLTVSSFFCIPLDETISTYFLAPFYCSGALSQPKVTGFYTKQACKPKSELFANYNTDHSRSSQLSKI